MLWIRSSSDWRSFDSSSLTNIESVVNAGGCPVGNDAFMGGIDFFLISCQLLLPVINMRDIQGDRLAV